MAIAARPPGGQAARLNMVVVSATALLQSPARSQELLRISKLPDLAVRHGKWKLLCDYNGNLPQLYDLSIDPGESKNLTDSQPEIARELVGKVVAWHRSIK